MSLGSLPLYTADPVFSWTVGLLNDFAYLRDFEVGRRLDRSDGESRK